MKLFSLLFVLVPALALANVERSLGVSPDGRHDLVLIASSEDDYGRVFVRDSKSQHLSETDSGQGYSHFPADDIHAIWKESSDAFAITMRGTKRTWHTDVYIREGDAWEKLAFPPYVANILGRLGVIQGGRSFLEEFGSFEDGNRFVLFCHVEPDWQQQEQAAKFKDWKPATQNDWRVVLEYQHRASPNCVTVSIEPNDKEKAKPEVE